MTKNNFLHRNSMAGSLKASGAVLSAACLCLLAASCSKDILPGEEGGKGGGEGASVSLHFPVSIDKQLSEADARSGNLLTRGAIIEGTEFPEGAEIGLFITKDSPEGGDVFEGSGKNIKAVLTRDADGTLSWKYFKPLLGLDSMLPIPEKEITGTVGKHIKVLAYYPYNSSADILHGIPFNVQNLGGGTVKELLYNKQANQKVKIPANGEIPLSFARAYSRITLKIRKTVKSGSVTLGKVSIANVSGDWIKVLGQINPATGKLISTAKPTSGDIYDNTGHVITGESVAVYDFPVPAFLDKEVASGQIAFIVEVAGKNTVFPLDRVHLNSIEEGGVVKYGFAPGYQNTYELLYDDLALSLQLKDWTSVSPEGDFGVIQESGKRYKEWFFDRDSITVALSGSFFKDTVITDHRYENYLTDMYRKNNGKVNVTWLGYTDVEGNFNYIWQYEPPRKTIDFALKDVLPIPVQWRREDFILTAKELCRNYREGGYDNWRLPRLSEWYMFAKVLQSHPEKLYFLQQIGGEIPGANTYWSGTEQPMPGRGEFTSLFLNNNGMCIRLIIEGDRVEIVYEELSLNSLAMVRCVRDAEPAPSFKN